MALSTDGKLVYLLEVDDKGSPVIKKFSSNIEKVGKSSARAATSAKKLNTSLLGMKSAIAGLGVGLLAKQMLDAGRAFESSVSDLSAITGATGKNLEFMKNKALEFSKQTTQSAQASVEAFKLVASAKPDLLDNADALARVTREAIKLSEASGVTLSDSAQTVGASLNQFSADADEAASFVNVLAAGAKFGSSEIGDTAQALKVAGTVAHDTGLSFEETNAAIQAMAAVALKGSEAGTGLRGVLLKLENQANDQFKPSIVGMADAFKNLRDANLTTTEKTKLFGMESITSANALIKQADSLKTLTGKLTDTNTATDQAKTKTNNLNSDINKLSHSFEDLGIGGADAANVGLRAIVQGLTDMISTGSNASKKSEELSLAIAATADIAGNAARLIAAPFQVTVDTIGSVEAAISLLFDGSMKDAVVALTAGGNDVIDVFDKMTSPEVANRFTILAQKMIDDTHKIGKEADNARGKIIDLPAETKPTIVVDAATVEPTIQEINAEINKLSKEATIKAVLQSKSVSAGVIEVNQKISEIKTAAATVVSIDASQLPGDVANVQQILAQIPREIATVHRLVTGAAGGGVAPQQVQGSRATGGMIPHDGFYMMHAGERVVSNSQSFDININVPNASNNGDINWRDVVRNQIMPELALASQR